MAPPKRKPKVTEPRDESQAAAELHAESRPALGPGSFHDISLLAPAGSLSVQEEIFVHFVVQ